MSESDENARSSIRIVLVEPSHPGNIGAVARAMKTMAIDDLVLVRPARFPDPQAEWRAANAVDVLDAAAVVDDLSDAIADAGLVVGTSTRVRRVPWPLISAEEFGARVARGEGAGRPIAILFGREASGLTNDELMRCQMHLQIPANHAYPSLNLAMAVQVVTYELFKQTGAEAQQSKRTWDRRPAATADVEAFYAHLQRVLTAIDFYDPEAPRAALVRLKRMFGRIQLDETEVGMLRGILTHIERFSDAVDSDAGLIEPGGELRD